MPETTEKLALVRAYLKQHQLDGAVFASRGNFAWLTGGGDNHIVSQTERGFAALAVTARSAWLLANTIESDRIIAEEPVSPFTLKQFPWVESMATEVKRLANGKHFASDDPSFTELPPLPGDFVDEVRSELTEPEIRRFKSLGRDCALVIETVARHLNLGDSEHQVEADMARHLLARGIQPTVLLVAFDERIKRYRHPTPTSKHLGKMAMLVICGQRHGLVASQTRLVHFGQLPADLAARHEAVCRVETALWAATKPGATWGEVLAAGIAQYQAEGFAKEWELHHQGGPAGYAARDLVATPGETRKVRNRQAVAWNPSITGTKSEDTFIIDGDQRHVITACSPEWPTLTVSVGSERLTRPAILVRG